MTKVKKTTAMKGMAMLAALMVSPFTLSAQSELYPGHFDLEEVRLLDSPFRRAMELNDSLLFEYDVDRLLTAAISSSRMTMSLLRKPAIISTWAPAAWRALATG